MHKLLERQLRRHFGDPGAVPPALRALLDDVERTYHEADADRRFVERSLELTSQELMQANTDLRAKAREQQQFLNNAAHELGTPLTPIRLQIHLLRSRMRDGTHDLAQVKAVDILDRNFSRLGSLVRDLLDAARLEAASIKLRLDPVDLRDVIYSSVETYVAPAQEAGVELRLGDLPTALPVQCDMSRISQVLDNLLSNAVKFTPRGRHIDVDAQIIGGMARVSVRDQGAGMRPEDLVKLFKPFSQVHDTMQTTLGGTGLGLYISKGLVQAHGGSIQATSEGLGHGSTFSFEIPLRSVHGPQGHAHMEAAAAS